MATVAADGGDGGARARLGERARVRGREQREREKVQGVQGSSTTPGEGAGGVDSAKQEVAARARALAASRRKVEDNLAPGGWAR